MKDKSLLNRTSKLHAIEKENIMKKGWRCDTTTFKCMARFDCYNPRMLSCQIPRLMRILVKFLGETCGFGSRKVKRKVVRMVT